ncbi:MAG TPA: cation transporter [Chloroflexota bacterium]|nr:cation transporter [Chloroflexota bacterium]
MIELRRARVAHAVPGRVRIKLDRDALTNGFGAELRSGLAAIPGVEEVQVAELTGSVLIRYDPERLDLNRLVERVRAARLLAVDDPGEDPYAAKAVPASLTAQRIQRAFHEVDVRLSELTQGRWDLRSVVPVSFGLLAVREIVRNYGQLGFAPWYVLAWYAFDSFWKLNQDRKPGSDLYEPPPERSGGE